MAKVIYQTFADANLSKGASNTTYNILGGGADTTGIASEANAKGNFRIAGTLMNLYVNIITNDRAASTLRTRKATSNGNEVVTVTGSTTGKFEDTTNTDTVAQGDDWHYQFVTGAGGTVFTYALLQILFSANSNTVLEHTDDGTSTSGTAATLDIVVGSHGATNATEANQQWRVKTACTWQNSRIAISVNSRGSDSTMRSRVAGVNGNQSITITASTTGNYQDDTNTDVLTTGTKISYRIVTAGASGTQTWTTMGGAISTTNNSFHLIVGHSSSQTVVTSTTDYFPIAGDITNPSASESDVTAEANMVFTMSNLQTFLTANSVSAASTLRTRIATANGNQVISITASTTGYFEDATNTDSVTAAQNINYSLVTGGTGTSLAMKTIGVLATGPSALVVDATSSGHSDSASSINITHTCVSGAVLAVAVYYGTNGSTIPTPTTRACTYNGTSMTESVTNNGGSGFTSMFTLTNPAAGTHTINITRNNSGASISGFGISFTGADGSTPFGNTANSNNGGPVTPPYSSNLTISRNNNYSVESQSLGEGSNQPTLITEQSGQTQIAEFDDAGGADASAGAYKLQTSSGTAALAYSWTGGTHVQPSWVAIEVNTPAVAATTGASFLLNMI